MNWKSLSPNSKTGVVFSCILIVLFLILYIDRGTRFLLAILLDIVLLPFIIVPGLAEIFLNNENPNNWGGDMLAGPSLLGLLVSVPLWIAISFGIGYLIGKIYRRLIRD